MVGFRSSSGNGRKRRIRLDESSFFGWISREFTYSALMAVVPAV
jgi:hypothetical protein